MVLFIISSLLLGTILISKVYFAFSEPLLFSSVHYLFSIIFPTVLLLSSIVLYKKDRTPKQKYKWSNLGILSLLLSIFILGFSFYISLINKALGWDAVALYEARSLLLQYGVSFSEMVSISRFDPQNAYYYVLYPPYTSIIHYFWRITGINFPIGLYYSTLLLLFAISVFELSKRHLGRNFAALLVFLTIANNQIFSSSVTEYTNLPYSLQIFLGVLFLFSFLEDRKRWKLLQGIVLIATSQWIRILEPIWLAVLISLVVAIIYKKEFKKLFIVPAVLGVLSLIEYLSWSDFVQNIAKSPSIVSFELLRLFEPVLGVFTGSIIAIGSIFVSLWGLLLLIHVAAIVGSVKRITDSKVIFLKSFIASTIAVYFLGFYFVSFQSTWWDKLGGSLIRSSTFLIPISGYLILSYLSKWIKRLKLENDSSHNSLLNNLPKVSKYTSNIVLLVWLAPMFISLVEAIKYPGFFRSKF